MLQFAFILTAADDISDDDLRGIMQVLSLHGCNLRRVVPKLLLTSVACWEPAAEAKLQAAFPEHQDFNGGHEAAAKIFEQAAREVRERNPNL